MPDSVSERIRSTSVSRRRASARREAAGGGRERRPREGAAGFAATGPARFRPESVSRRRLSMSSSGARRVARSGAAGRAPVPAARRPEAAAGSGGAGAGARAGPCGTPRSRSVRSSSTSEKMSDEVSGRARPPRAATCRCASSWRRCPPGRAPPGPCARKSSSEKGRRRMSKAPTFWASAFGWSPCNRSSSG